MSETEALVHSIREFLFEAVQPLVPDRKSEVLRADLLTNLGQSIAELGQLLAGNGSIRVKKQVSLPPELSDVATLADEPEVKLINNPSLRFIEELLEEQPSNPSIRKKLSVASLRLQTTYCEVIARLLTERGRTAKWSKTVRLANSVFSDIYSEVWRDIVSATIDRDSIEPYVAALAGLTASKAAKPLRQNITQLGELFAQVT